MFYSVVYVMSSQSQLQVFPFTHSFSGSSDLVSVIKKMTLHWIWTDACFLIFWSQLYQKLHIQQIKSYQKLFEKFQMVSIQLQCTHRTVSLCCHIWFTERKCRENVFNTKPIFILHIGPSEVGTKWLLEAAYFLFIKPTTVKVEENREKVSIMWKAIQNSTASQSKKQIYGTHVGHLDAYPGWCIKNTSIKVQGAGN